MTRLCGKMTLRLQSIYMYANLFMVYMPSILIKTCVGNLYHILRVCTTAVMVTVLRARY